MGQPVITIIIPTRGARERAVSLLRAAESVLEQDDVDARVMLIVNGARGDPVLSPHLHNDSRVEIYTRPTAHLVDALREGLSRVATPFFGTLDDDDLLLPGALKVRHAALERHADRLVVVTNGYLRNGGQDRLHVQDAQAIEADPLRALLQRNWVLPGSWLARTTSVTRTLFDSMPHHLENTYLGIRFSRLPMLWLQTPTVVHHLGDPHSVSRSREYTDGQAAALRLLLTLDLPRDVHRTLRRRIPEAQHHSAVLARRAGDLRAAWRWHLASLFNPTGWRYLPFTARLMMRSVVRQEQR